MQIEIRLRFWCVHVGGMVLSSAMIHPTRCERHWNVTSLSFVALERSIGPDSDSTAEVSGNYH